MQPAQAHQGSPFAFARDGDSQPKPLVFGFTQRSRRLILALTALAVLTHALSTGQLIRRQAENSLLAQARACAAMMVPGRNGDLSASVQNLTARFDRLVAVASLGPRGELQRVHPDTPGYRAAAQAVLAPPVEPVRLSLPGVSNVGGVILPLNGDEWPGARHVIVLLRMDSYLAAMAFSSAVVGLVVGFVALAGLWFTRRWLALGVSVPLRAIAGYSSDDCQTAATQVRPAKEIIHPRVKPPLEITEIADGVLRRIARADARIRKLEHESEAQLRRRVVGFDRQLRRVQDLATIDTLTRVRNRTFLEDSLERLFDQHRRSRRDLAAAMIDIDNFKPFNDRYGHLAGDEVLRFVGSLLAGHLRPEDCAIRFGGDEFLLLLPGAGVEEAKAICRRIIKLFARHAMQFGNDHGLSISAGIASLGYDNPRNGHALVAGADAALYEAKRKGKNSVACCQPKQKAAAERQLSPV